MVERPGKSFFARHRTVGLDTNIFIYLVEDHPRYSDWCELLFGRIQRREIIAVTSTVTLLEALVLPYRLQNDGLAQKYYALLYSFPNLIWHSVSIEIADLAAELRVRYRLNTPDAIQIATTIEANGTAFLGNDKGLKKVREIECFALEDII